MLKDLLGVLEGRERFDVLFALALAYQRNSQWAEAQPVLDEALELVRAEPADDQIVSFALCSPAWRTRERWARQSSGR
jgi:hypothetical protein